MSVRSVVLHGHFYQPPRENPWLEYVETEATATPFHDWNQRIEAECYRAVVAARIPDGTGRITRIVNVLERMSFDFGPTLLEWMEDEAPDTYRAVLEADAASCRASGGHGNAIAAPYHHVILPLATRRDKVTEVRWGIADFRRRFGRAPEGMWLPETAVDDETLDVLAEQGITFTILGPHQVRRVPAGGLPGRYTTRRGRSIALFLYDGGLSHDVAFGQLLTDAYAWAKRMLETGGAAPGAVAALATSADAAAWAKRLTETSGATLPTLVSLATDGETFGHHHKFAEMALAKVIEILEQRPDVTVTNYAAFLAAAHPAAEPVELVEPSSWSCPHGVERWRSDCGCRVAPERGWNQKWRAPLRSAVEWLAAELHRTFEVEGGALLKDPWAARDAYGATRGSGVGAIGDLVASHAARPLTAAEAVRVRELLALEHDALALFTSCAWFFDDIGGLEPLQAMRYAAHAIELAGPMAARLENGFAQRLAEAVSNDPAVGDGRKIFLEQARPKVPPAARVAGSFVALRRHVPGPENDRLYCYDLTGGGARVQVVHRRSGRVAVFDVGVQPLGGWRFAVSVAPPGAVQGAAAHLTIADLTERERWAVTAALIAEIMDRVLTPEESAALCHGGGALAEVAERGLVWRLNLLPRDPTDSAPAVLDLLDLLELLGRAVPFDAQTAFYRARGAMRPDRAQKLAAIAERLGFAAGA